MKLSAIVAAVAGLAVSGCLPPSRDELPQNAVFHGQQMVSAKFTYPVPPGADIIGAAQKCAIKELGNDTAVLRETIPTYDGTAGIGIASGVVGGGPTIENVGRDFVVLNGTGTYPVLLTYRIVAFRLLVEDSGGAIDITANNLRHLQADSGYARNTGFTPIYANGSGVWEDAWKIIQGSADRLAACIARS